MRVVLLLLLVVGSSLLAVGTGEQAVWEIKRLIGGMPVSTTTKHISFAERDDQPNDEATAGQQVIVDEAQNTDPHQRVAHPEKLAQELAHSSSQKVVLQQTGEGAGTSKINSSGAQVTTAQPVVDMVSAPNPVMTTAGSEDIQTVDGKDKTKTKGGKRTVAKTVPDEVPDLPVDAVLGPQVAALAPYEPVQDIPVIEPMPVEYQDVYTIHDIHETNREALLVLESIARQQDR